MAIKGSGKGLPFLQAHVGYDGEGCLLWPFGRDSYGYAQFGLSGKTIKAHRWMCEAVNGPAPSDRNFAAHECGNGHLGCVHPKHLQWKTQLENAQDSVRHGAFPNKKGQRRSKLNEAQVNEIKSLRGIKTNIELARTYGVSLRLIAMIFQGRVWNGDRSRTRDLTAPQVIQIRRLRGIKTQQAIADEMGIGRSAVWRVLTGAAYSSVKDDTSAQIENLVT